MRILMHDYGRFAFPLQLSRTLASRGHRVRHLFSDSVPGPQEQFELRYDDPITFELAGLRIRGRFAKDTLFRRRSQEIAHGQLAQEHVYEFQPDVVISSNTPLEAQNILQQASATCNARFVYWVQDLHGLAIWNVLRRRMQLLGELIGRYYIQFERNLFRRSDSLIVITNDFCRVMESAGVSQDRLHIIPNWAPLEELPCHSKDNAWAREHGLCDKRCFIYTGTLALKHNPDLLLLMARHFLPQQDVRIVVISSGKKSDELKNEAAARGLHNLVVLPFQPREVFPSVLATADVLISILEPDAGEYCVPSKVLTYFCACRPVLLSVPPENLIARIVMEHNAGYVRSPYDTDGFIQAAQELINNSKLRENYGRNGLAYARQHFDIAAIADEFEKVMHGLQPPLERMPKKSSTHLGSAS